MVYVSIASISRRWQVDPATARTALERAEIPRSEIHAAPRYSSADILREIERWPSTLIGQVDLEARLEKADQLADRLGVTRQTVRNYGREGRLHRIEITPRAIRYCLPIHARNPGEAKIGDDEKK